MKINNKSIFSVTVVLALILLVFVAIGDITGSYTIKLIAWIIFWITCGITVISGIVGLINLVIEKIKNEDTKVL